MRNYKSNLAFSSTEYRHWYEEAANVFCIHDHYLLSSSVNGKRKMIHCPNTDIQEVHVMDNACLWDNVSQHVKNICKCICVLHCASGQELLFKLRINGRNTLEVSRLNLSKKALTELIN